MRRRPFRGGIALGACALAVSAGPAQAADNDGAYGRLDGDLDLSLGAGMALVEGGPSFAASAGALYFQTAGIYVTYMDSFGASSYAVARSIATGVALRPLFIGRYANDLERGPAHLDLALDSFELEVGAFWAQPTDQSFEADPGLELGARIEVPILPRASGPFLFVRGAVRWRSPDLASDRAHVTLAERGAFFACGLSWHEVVLAHVIDAGDQRIK
jgi:hypothetical protein